MDELTASQRDTLSRTLHEREQVLRDEIRSGLAERRGEADANVLSGTPDAGDAALAALIAEVGYAEVARDAAELRDVLAAEARFAAGTYGICIDCEEPVPYARLAAYPMAKRCLRCQKVREATRAP